MGIRYKIESNGKNILTVRTYYKKGSNFFIVEESKKEFNIITKNPPECNYEQNISFYELSEYNDTSYKSTIEKFIFSSGVEKEEQKQIRKLFKNRDEDKLPKLGWKFYDKSTKIFGESDIIQTTYNKLDFYGYLTEINCIEITKKQFEEYSKEGIKYSEIDSDKLNDGGYGSLFTDSSCELHINEEEYPIKERLEKLIKSNSKNIVNHFSSLEIVRESFYKGGHFELEIYEEFDPKKFNISVENYVKGKNKKSICISFIPNYDGVDFEYKDGGYHKDDDWSLIDEKGNVHSLEFKDEDSDEESEDGDQDEKISNFLDYLRKRDEENEDEDEDMEHKISTTEPNMIFEIEKWTLNSKQLQITKTYESGYVIVDLEPYLPDYDEKIGIDVNDSSFWIQQEDFNNPTYSYKILKNLTEKELHKLKEKFGTEFD